MKILNYQDLEAKTLLEQGYILAMPTETVYGVGVRWDDSEAYERLCRAKNRRPSKPIAVMASPSFDFNTYFVITPQIRNVMTAFLPGPLTVLVRAKENAPEQIHLGTCVAGIRIPAKQDLLSFLSALPFPLQVTSANLSGAGAATSFEEVYDTFKDNSDVKGIVQGTCESGTPTTVVDLTGNKPIVVREGDIKLNQIEAEFYKGL